MPETRYEDNPYSRGNQTRIEQTSSVATSPVTPPTTEVEHANKNTAHRIGQHNRRWGALILATAMGGGVGIWQGLVVPAREKTLDDQRKALATAEDPRNSIFLKAALLSGGSQEVLVSELRELRPYGYQKNVYPHWARTIKYARLLSQTYQASRGEVPSQVVLTLDNYANMPQGARTLEIVRVADKGAPPAPNQISWEIYKLLCDGEQHELEATYRINVQHENNATKGTIWSVLTELRASDQTDLQLIKYHSVRRVIEEVTKNEEIRSRVEKLLDYLKYQDRNISSEDLLSSTALWNFANLNIIQDRVKPGATELSTHLYQLENLRSPKSIYAALSYAYGFGIKLYLSTILEDGIFKFNRDLTQSEITGVAATIRGLGDQELMRLLDEYICERNHLRTGSYYRSLREQLLLSLAKTNSISPDVASFERLPYVPDYLVDQPAAKSASADKMVEQIIRAADIYAYDITKKYPDAPFKSFIGREMYEKFDKGAREAAMHFRKKLFETRLLNQEIAGETEALITRVEFLEGRRNDPPASASSIRPLKNLPEKYNKFIDQKYILGLLDAGFSAVTFSRKLSAENVAAEWISSITEVFNYQAYRYGFTLAQANFYPNNEDPEAIFKFSSAGELTELELQGVITKIVAKREAELNRLLEQYLTARMGSRTDEAYKRIRQSFFQSLAKHKIDENFVIQVTAASP